MKVHNFKELKVWQKAMDLCVLCYSLTACFPKEEKYGLITQVQRAAVSIPSNIAEGCGRIGEKELKHFITISMGSSYELETQVMLAFRFGYIQEERIKHFEIQTSEVQRMLFGFYNSLKSS